jgi:hypothetical protein
VADFASDITTNNVEENGTEIPIVAFNHERPSDVITDLANFAGCDWWVDYDSDLHFKRRGKNMAPFSLKETIGGSEQTHIKNSLQLKKSDKQITNVVFVVGDDYEGNPVTDERIAKGDGNQKTFDTIYKFSEKPTVKVNGVVQTVGVAYLDDPASFDVLWSFNEKNLVWSTAPADTLAITVSGKPLIPLFVRLEAPDVSRGTYEKKIVDPSLQTYEAVRDRAKAELEAYADSISGATFRTYRSGLEPGQKMFVSSQVRGITNEEYIIQRVVITMHDHSRFVYNVTLANVAEYDIISFLRQLLRDNQRALDFQSNVTQQLMKIIGYKETVQMAEAYIITGNKIIPVENVEVSEGHSLKVDFEPTLVWGPYEQTSIDDTTRSPVWGGGTNWEE